jgi:hypothetical protein
LQPTRVHKWAVFRPGLSDARSFSEAAGSPDRSHWACVGVVIAGIGSMEPIGFCVP